MPLPLVIYGRETCQDTQLVRSRLHALGVPAEERDVERSPDAAERVKSWNRGSLSTPTLVFGDEDRVVAEPSLDAVDELARWAGYEVESPRATQLHGDTTARPVPARTLPDAAGGSASVAAFRERAQLALFFPHSTACLACRSYAHALLSAGETLAATGSTSFAVAPASAADAVAWLQGEARLPGRHVLADEGAIWRMQVAAAIPELAGAVTAGGALAAGSPFVLLLDRWQAPRVVSIASEAGGLISVGEIGEWLAFLSQECGECTIELSWDESRE